MEEQLKGIIDFLELKRGFVGEDRDTLATIIIGVQNLLERYYSKDNAFVKQVNLLHQYVSLLQSCKKDQYSIYSRCNTRDIAYDLKALIDAVMDEISTVGLPNTSKVKASKSIQITNNLSQSQTQNQEQNVIVKVLLEAVKDELTGKQRKELLEIANAAKNPKEAHKGIMEKLKEYGAEVPANIVANILTNPDVWAYFGSLL